MPGIGTQWGVRNPSSDATDRSLRAVAPVLGLVSTTLLALGACAHAFSFRGRWGWAPVDAIGDLVDGRGGLLSAVGVTGVLLAWWLLRPGPGHAAAGPLVAVLWSLPLLLAPPVLSADAFAYADIGWMLHVGADLDQDALASQGGPYVSAVDPFWAGKLTVYPELAVRLAHLGAAVTGYDAFWGALAQRVVAVLAMVVAAALLLRLADLLGVDRGWALWCGVLNPLVLLHLVGGAHNDAPMIAMTLVALYVAARWGRERWWVTWLVAPALVGLAAMVKPQALVALVPIMLWPVVAAPSPGWRGLANRAARVLGGIAVAGGVVVLVGLAAGRSLGWLAQLLENGQVPALGPALIVVETLSRGTTLLGVSAPWAVDAGLRLTMLAALATSAWLFVTRPGRPLAVAAWTALLVAAGSGILVPWHLCLGVVLLAIVTPLTRATYAIVLLVSGYVLAAAYLQSFGLHGPVLLLVALGTSALLLALDRALGRPAAPDTAQEPRAELATRA